MKRCRFNYCNFTMSKNSSTGRSKSATATFFSDGFLFAGGSLVAFLLVWALCSFFAATPTFSTTTSFPDTAAAASCPDSVTGPDPLYDSPEKNFYDDPELKYTIDSPPVKNWDEKRREWLKQHPSFAAGAEGRILMVSGSQPAPCKNHIGDYLLLKLLKNKVDYCRRHGIALFFNNVLFQPKMFSFWAKTPAVKAAMLAHPEAEWIWWVDSDAAFTDMDFDLPLGRYGAHNMVIHGWPELIYGERRSWTSINAGVFLIRNCQWAMDFMDVWARMGPQDPDYEKWGEILRTTFKDKNLPESDDQSGLAYLLLKEKEKWGEKIYLENEYYFEGYWLEIVGTFENTTAEYGRVEAGERRLRRRHAEAVSRGYGRAWEEELKGVGGGRGSWRRPFITHFTGCQPCSGDHNRMYSGRACFDAMQRALTFADNQVLRNYGFVHPDLQDPSTVEPLPFDYPAN